jgi:hypothetical protein
VFLDTIVSTKKGNVTMITQVLKRWLQKIAGWFSGKEPAEAEYAQVLSPLNKGMTQETASRASSEAIMPQPGIAHQAMGQGETSCSTINEWPERVMQSTPPPSEKAEPLSPSTPATPIHNMTPPTETTSVTTKENPVSKSKPIFPDAPPPTPEQQLEFMHYLVKRGIVNEGFTEGQVPEQYRKH